jgi:thiamine-monophosphate kinase
VALALTGGEDYEVCLVAPRGALEAWTEAFRQAFGIPLTRVGVVREGSGVHLDDGGGNRRLLERGGFSHFPGREPE